jgi:hypothetical protein
MMLPASRANKGEHEIKNVELWVSNAEEAEKDVMEENMALVAKKEDDEDGTWRVSVGHALV